MSSLHARRPPKLEQGDLGRNKQRRPGHTQIMKGGGSLRRPPNAGGVEVVMGGGGNGGSGGPKKKFCSLWRIIVSVLVVILLAFIFMQIRDLLGLRGMKLGGSTLRANQEEIINADSEAKPG